MKLIKQVLDYNKAYKINTPHTPKLLSTQLWETRQDVLQQDMNNMHSAWVEKDIHNVALSICNSIYDLMSLACETGLQNHLEACLDELHRSKMSNLDENGAAIFIDGEPGLSTTYTPPNIRKILESDAGA